MRTHIRSDGFTSPANRRLGGEHSAAVAQLTASAALVLSTLVAATAVGLTMPSLPHHPRHPKTHG